MGLPYLTAWATCYSCIFPGCPLNLRELYLLMNFLADLDVHYSVHLRRWELGRWLADKSSLSVSVCSMKVDLNFIPDNAIFNPIEIVRDI